jgi:Bacterial membrane protein YfhO
MVFYKDVAFHGQTFLMETAARGTMPGAGPYKYEGVQPGFVVNDAGAIAWYREPFNRFISTSVKKGDFPLWNPYAGLAGSPLLADGQTGPLEPLQLLFFFIPDHFWPLAIDFQLLIRFFIAGFTCYLFAQRQKINFFGSISAGILFMLSSYFVTYGNHPQIKTEALLPLVLYGYDRLVESNDRLGFWLCALFIGWAISAAMPESTFFVLFLGTLWYFYKSLLQWHNYGYSFQGSKNLLLRYLGSTVFGFLISAAYLLPFLEFVFLAKSIHSPGTGSSPYPLQLIPGLIFQIKPQFFLHLGFFALFSLVYLLLNFKNWSKYHWHIIFFSLYTVILILTMFDFPITNWISQLPVFNQLDLEKYPLPSIVFCLAILVGIFIDRAKQLALSYKKLSISLLILFTIFIGIPRVKSLESVSNYSSDLEFISIAFGLIIIISLMLYLLAVYQRRPLFSQYLVQITLLIIVAMEPFFWGIRINRPDRFDPFQVPPFINFLHKEENFRIFGLDGTLYPNISTAYHLADIRWLSALVSQRTYDFTARFIESNEVNSLRLTGTILPISDNMFDLLNVKYILKQNSYIKGLDNCLLTTDDQPYFGKNTLNQLIYEQNRGKKNFFPALPLNINGATRMGIFAQPPQGFATSLIVPNGASNLNFSIGLNPGVFRPEYGDGVTFKIILLEQESKVEIFSKYVDPKNNPCDRKWFDESLDLKKWAGKEVTLRFTTMGGPARDISYDWAYWGDIQLAAVANSISVEGAVTHVPYNLVYQDQDVLIYQNTDVYQRAFVVYDLINASSFNQALDLLANPNIDLRQTAIVENLPIDLKTDIEKGKQKLSSGLASIKQITPDSLAVEVETNSPGLLVVSEQYYPGWHACVDGKETPIYAVDGILRGVFLSAGKHTVIFEYKPLSFSIGLMVSVTSLFVTIVYLIHFSKKLPHVES